MRPSNKHLTEIMLNDSDSPASEDEQIYVGSVTAETQSPTHKQKEYVVISTPDDWFVKLEVHDTKKKQVLRLIQVVKKCNFNERLPSTEKPR